MLACAVLLISLFTEVLPAQDSISNLHSRTLRLSLTNPQPNTLSRDPQFFQLFDAKGVKISPDRYLWNGNNLVVDSSLAGQQVTIKTRSLPLLLLRKSAGLDTGVMKRTYDGRMMITAEDDAIRNDLFSKKKGLEYGGVYSRGITLGNTQSLALNSAFNIQLNGVVGDDIKVNAILNDNSVPIQPDGNTQRLQDLDRIFINLSRKGHMVKAGDFDISKPSGYFMNYYKKLQGGQYSNLTKLGVKDAIQTEVSAALTRGKFSRQEIKGIERNQGPYRLLGRDNERFIIVLSGSEKVFLDGILLKRGIDEDYIVDYNRADITFTNKRIITNYSRIIVEFEYNTASYNRSILTANSKWTHANTQFYINGYQEQDGKSLNSGATLSPEAISQIANTSSNEIILSGVDTVNANNADPVRYQKKDTIVGTVLFKILVYDPSGNAIYTARFTDLGTNKGNYVRSGATVNGQIYQWVAPNPTTGLPSGNYEPIYRLIAPAKLQLLTLGGEVKFKHSRYFGEVARSSLDRNRYSSSTDSLREGLAYRLGLDQRFNLDTAKKWALTTNFHFEHLQSSFRFLNPFRNAEFIRDWNLVPGITGTENLGSGGFGLHYKETTSLSGEMNYFHKEGSFEGWRQKWSVNVKERGWHLWLNLSYLKGIQTQLGGARFFRPNGELSKLFGANHQYKIGVAWEVEKNKLTVGQSDSLNNQSFWFDSRRIFFEKSEGKQFSWKLSLTERVDYLPKQNDFTENTKAQDYGIEGRWQPNANNITTFSLIRRNFASTNALTLNTLLGRLDQQILGYKGFIRGNLTYEVSSGQEQKIEYNYVKVFQGQGNYTWIDRNKDDVAQLDEFEVAPIAGLADYIRVVVFSNQFVPTNNISLNANLSFDPKAKFTKDNQWQNIARKFFFQSNAKVIRKIRSDAGEDAFNPFSTPKSDTSLVNALSSYRNLLQFNRSNPVYDVQLIQASNLQKLILINGLERRVFHDFILRTRVNYTNSTSSIINLGYSLKENASQALTSRNYQITVQKVQHQLLWIYRNNLRIEQSIKLDKIDNKIGLKEAAIVNNNSLEVTYNQNSKRNIRCKLEWISIDYSGLKNTALEFILLDGLAAGKNFVWGIQFDQRITTNTQFSLNYDARKSESSQAIHNVRAQIRATF